MTPSKLLDWRKAIVYMHRWLGIGGMLFFLVWFASGILFLYADMPGLSAEERLRRLKRLDVAALRVSPAEAASGVRPSPTRMRLAMLGGRPVYRFLSDSTWVGVYADTGLRTASLTGPDAIGVLAEFVPERRTFRHDARLLDSDQWSLYSGIRSQMPLHRIALDDAEETYYYVTEHTGDVILKTTARGRRWAYASAVLHWLYFPPLRRHSELWRNLVTWLALIGCVLCGSGLVWGVWRFSSRRRYRFPGVERSRSPYAGMMRWHHYAGLVVGLFAFTWALSGALSLNPFAVLRARPGTPAQVGAATGGPVNLSLIPVEALRASVEVLGGEFPVKELEYLQFRGQPYALAYRPPDAGEALPGMTGDVTGLLEESLDRDLRLVSLRAPAEGAFRRFEAAGMSAVARAAMPGVPVRDEAWLDRYDAYYYTRKIRRPLPVLRVRFDDPQATWLYLDPQHGRIASRLERRDRWNRWLYHGLHSLDFPALYAQRPLWDVVVIALCLGGIALSVTTLLPAIRRLRRRGADLTSRWRFRTARQTGL